MPRSDAMMFWDILSPRDSKLSFKGEVEGFTEFFTDIDEISEMNEDRSSRIYDIVFVYQLLNYIRERKEQQIEEMFFNAVMREKEVIIQNLNKSELSPELTQFIYSLETNQLPEILNSDKEKELSSAIENEIEYRQALMRGED
ncbi:hypothetical protein M0R04_03870 [Candidatus Dojkabacteria bacterium]|nr:hypothetical protein [Candidatus Dojkabacteria bacterium]